jgi:hypothetical protein
VCGDVASGRQAPDGVLLPLFSTPLSEYFSHANSNALPKCMSYRSIFTRSCLIFLLIL